MSQVFRFETAAARRMLILHHLRVRHLLSGLPAKVRRDLEAGLDEHLLEVFEHSPAGDEHDRLKAALERLGDPRDFLSPLIGDALLKLGNNRNGPSALLSNMLALAGSGARTMAVLSLNLFLGASGFVMTVFSLTVTFRPGRAGVFQIGPDSYQIRIVGWPTEDVSVLPIWGGLLIGVAGIGLAYLAQRWVRRAATALILRAFPLSGNS